MPLDSEIFAAELAQRLVISNRESAFAMPQSSMAEMISIVEGMDFEDSAIQSDLSRLL
jgi:hypothetical protein